MIGPYLSPMNYKLDKDVDRFVNDLLDRQPVIVRVEDYYAYFQVDEKVISIWITNRWFAYASRANLVEHVESGDWYRDTEEIYDKRRPYRKTMVRLYKYIRANASPPKHMPTLDEVLKEAA